MEYITSAMGPVLHAVRQAVPGYSLGFLSLGVAAILIFVPHVAKIIIFSSAVGGGKYDVRAPRVAVAKATETLKGQKAGYALQRAEGAHINQIEGYGLFAAAILSAYVAGVPTSSIDAVGVYYVLSRVVYIALYLIGVHPAIAAMRSLVWLNCVGSCAVLMFASARAAAASGKF